ncbi:hypothetical protein XM53_08900 [Roseovarius atlanticus]|uniref:Uncharacterized protein n=1 Tax=Roseovarius atlanticus TaxID=1641875 RepID=A0A0T5NV49_9RHOB|nr:hypothetical protein [Roseovarius atlanticus]KRS12700.1 hypothetical protein XM53_08900 [Roseovarius atlanticus]
MTMTEPDVLNPHPPEFERFLYASVGEDRNGYVVTVLSTFARLDLDPWMETAELVRLKRDAAQKRLGTLLARFRDVPTLASDHDSVARDLSQLLPEGPVSGYTTRATSIAADAHPGLSGVIWVVLSIVFVILPMLILAGSGAGK